MWVILFIQGEILDLFPDDEVEGIIGSVRPEVRSLGLMDSRENCWKFFIERVRRQLKVKQQKVRHKMFSVLTESLISLIELIISTLVLYSNSMLYGGYSLSLFKSVVFQFKSIIY